MDAQVRVVLGRVLAQRRSVEVAFGYLSALSPGVRANCWSVAETARLARLAADHAAGLLTQARLAFRLRWSAWRRRHQAAARWYHHAARPAAAAT